MPIVVYKGPAQIEYNGNKYQSQGEVTVETAPDTFDVEIDAAGAIDQRVTARKHTISFIPSGQVSGEALDEIVTASGRIPGSSILGGSLVVRPLIASQQPITFARAGITTLPGLRLGASQTLFGNMVFTALAAVDDATGVIAVANSYVTPTSTFDPVNILTEPWKGTWATTSNPTANGSLFKDLETEAGWEISTEITTDNSLVDSIGIADITQSDFRITATCRPVSLTDAQMLEIYQRSTTGMNLRPGDSLHGRTGLGAIEKRTLFLTSRSGYTCNIEFAGVRDGQLIYSARQNRSGTLTFVGLRKYTSGVMQPMISFAAPSPP